MNIDVLVPFPTIETSRLRMRPLAADDADAVLAIFGDDDVTRFYDRETMRDRKEAEALIATLKNRYDTRAGLRWAMATKADRAFVGTIGFNSFATWADRAVLGYDVARRSWGQGLATEAVRAVVDWGHAVLRAHRIEALVMLGNDASVAVLEKCGFENEGVLRAYGRWKGQYHDLRMFSHVATPGH